jgi:hypothetical protein
MTPTEMIEAMARDGWRVRASWTPDSSPGATEPRVFIVHADRLADNTVEHRAGRAPSLTEAVEQVWDAMGKEQGA